MISEKKKHLLASTGYLIAALITLIMLTIAGVGIVHEIYLGGSDPKAVGKFLMLGLPNLVIAVAILGRKSSWFKTLMAYDRRIWVPIFLFAYLTVRLGLWLFTQ